MSCAASKLQAARVHVHDVVSLLTDTCCCSGVGAAGLAETEGRHRHHGSTGSASGLDYSSSNTGRNTTGGGVASYVPGTEANRESRAAHGQDPNQYTRNNQGYSSGNTGSGTGGGVASYIPGTEANRESRAASGQDPNRYTGSGSNQGYGSNTGSGTGGGVASYIPGTEANRESRAAHGQDPNRYTGSGSNQGYSSNTGSGSGKHLSQHLPL